MESVAGKGRDADRVQVLLRRANLLLEEGKWREAEQRCSEALDLDPECAEVYVAQLQAKLRVKEAGALGEIARDYSDDMSYKNACRFADDALREELKGRASSAKALASRKRKRRLVGLIVGVAVLAAAVVFMVVISNARQSAESIRAADVGDTVTFGSWEQDGAAWNGAESVKWLVLDKQDGHVLLLAKDILASRAYNDEFEDVTWETCTLRSWLNGEFYQTAFTAEERGAIQTTDVITPDNDERGRPGGDATQDKVFLLSLDEADRYFDDDDGRACGFAQAAVDEGLLVLDDYDCSFWWLRSPGYTLVSADYVGTDGFVYSIGSFVNNDFVGVRPALWV